MNGRRGWACLTAAMSLLSALPLGGCIALFRPAKPEPPLTNNCASDFQGEYDSPSVLLQTLVRAMQLRGRGRCAYITAFADSATEGYPFHTTFPTELIEERRRLDLPVPAWARSTELAFYDDFMEISDSPLALTWSPYQEAGSDTGDPAGGDSTLHRRYAVTPRAGAELLAAGIAELTFKRLPSGQWVIVQWRDQVDPSRGTDLSELLDLTMSQRRLQAYDAIF